MNEKNKYPLAQKNGPEQWWLDIVFPTEEIKVCECGDEFCEDINKPNNYERNHQKDIKGVQASRVLWF